MAALAMSRCIPFTSGACALRPRLAPRRPTLTVRANATGSDPTPEPPSSDLGKELSKLSKQTASTFAPRPSTATKNPALKGTVLYSIFEAQAWISMVVGGLLSYNVLFPTDEPSIPRLLGMWSIWMFTVPSLRAKECMPKEKDALNLLFVVIPLMNVSLPFLWKSFPFIFTANAITVFSVYYWKGVWNEVYGLPFGASEAAVPDSPSE